MEHPKQLSILNYTYALPEERIAQYPLGERDASRLLVYKEGAISEDTYRHLPEHLPADAFMVFNNTKVIEARLLFQKPTGGLVEIFCLEPWGVEPSTAMMQQGEAVWKCLVGGAGKWKRGLLEKVIGAGAQVGVAADMAEGIQEEAGVGRSIGVTLTVEKVDVVPDGFLIRFRWTPSELAFAEVLHRAGLIPLPPYMHRRPVGDDLDRYQTVYAQHDGSVAAPTAGLHFTAPVLGALRKKGVQTGFVTLHVGAGTFKPVKAPTMEGHVMHAEWIEVSVDFIQSLLAAKGPVVAVGTTSLRTLESLYWMGVKVLAGKAGNMEELCLRQWDVYDELPGEVLPRVALQGLLEWLKGLGVERLMAQTQLLIAPGYRVRMVQAIVTNFHQPQSTLLLLVAALLGEDWRRVYGYALDNGFRFLSYGDGSLLWINRGYNE